MLFLGTRYVHTSPYVDRKGVLLLTVRRKFTFSTVGAKYVRIRLGDTLDGLAFKYYGNALLGWAILDANPQYLSELDIKVGDIVTVPDFAEVVRISGGKV